MGARSQETRGHCSFHSAGECAIYRAERHGFYARTAEVIKARGHLARCVINGPFNNGRAPRQVPTAAELGRAIFPRGWHGVQKVLAYPAAGVTVLFLVNLMRGYNFARIYLMVNISHWALLLHNEMWRSLQFSRANEFHIVERTVKAKVYA